MMDSRRNGGSGGRASWTLRASAALALALVLVAVGCGIDQTDPNNGGGKGPEMQRTMTMGPGSPSGGQLSFSPPPTQAAAPAPPMLGVCKEGGPCSTTNGCISGCDPATSRIILCASCGSQGFTDCTQNACQPTSVPEQ